MNMIRSVAVSLLACVCVPVMVNAQGYKLIRTIPIEGTEAWDYLSVDALSRRMYVAHADEVVVIDLDSDKVVAKITGMIRVHAVVIDHARSLGYISDAGRSEIVVFDPKTLAVKDRIKAGTFPDGEVFDEPSHRVLAFNARSHDATVIDTSTGKVVGAVDLGGRPEFPVSDGQGKVFNNIVDKSEIIQIDPVAMKVVARWPLAPCQSPSGLAVDKENHKLFAVCANKMMAVVDANTGKILATPAIGAHPDAALYDPDSNTAFSSNGEGTLTLISARDPYPVIDTVKTAISARTMAMDPLTHKIYLAAADLGPTPAPTANDPTPSATAIPGTFRILVLDKE
jgi:DNA-binding beta-propeller fold protein YncE